MYSLPNFAVLEGESRHKSSAKQQQSAMFVSDILGKLSLSPRSAHHQTFTSLLDNFSSSVQQNSSKQLNVSLRVGLFIISKENNVLTNFFGPMVANDSDKFIS